MEERLIYFDNAATVWPKPEGVYKFMDEFYRSHGVNPGRSGYDLALEAGSLLDRTRKRLTKFFGGDEDAPERLVFGYNVTDALNLAIPGLVGQGDHVITTNLEHNSVIRPVNHMVRDHGADATYLPFNAQGFIEPDAVRKAVRPNTRLVIVNHGSNVIGTVQPIRGNRGDLPRTRSHLLGGYRPNRGSHSHQHERDEHRRARLYRAQGPDGKHGNRRPLGAQARRDSPGSQRWHWGALGGPISP